MSDNNILSILDSAIADWQPPHVPGDIPQGDMPGDRVWIGPNSVEKANVTFRAALPLLREVILNNPNHRAVIAVTGGSGVGKTCVSALLTYYLNCLGIGAYTMSGDNYPRRIPEQNDAERMRIFRLGGLRGLLAAGEYDAKRAAQLKRLQLDDVDSAPSECEKYPWLQHYQSAGRIALSGYLGTELEQEYDQLESVLKRFHDGDDEIWLKRLGRDAEAMWYDKKDFSCISVIVLEWTHGNSGKFDGVDIPILLNSTPAETREYRLARGRDSNADTAFITMVLELEQAKLEARASAAQLIISKSCEILTYDQFVEQMNAGR